MLHGCDSSALDSAPRALALFIVVAERHQKHILLQEASSAANDANRRPFVEAFCLLKICFLFQVETTFTSNQNPGPHLTGKHHHSFPLKLIKFSISYIKLDFFFFKWPWKKKEFCWVGVCSTRENREQIYDCGGCIKCFFFGYVSAVSSLKSCCWADYSCGKDKRCVHWLKCLCSALTLGLFAPQHDLHSFS